MFCVDHLAPLGQAGLDMWLGWQKKQMHTELSCGGLLTNVHVDKDIRGGQH